MKKQCFTVKNIKKAFQSKNVLYFTYISKVSRKVCLTTF